MARLAVLLMLIASPAAAYQPGQQPMFGTYSKAHLDRQQVKRWRELCRGAGRYQAMSEAYAASKPNPCR